MLLLAALAITGNVLAQNSSCVNSISRWWQDFGTGTTNTSHPDVPGSVNYVPGNTALLNGNQYRMSTNTLQAPGWHNASDHTGNADGRMLVMNGSDGTFYIHEAILSTPLVPGSYLISASVMNLYTPQACSPVAALPQFGFSVEYQTSSGNWVHFNNSPAITGAIQVTTAPQWIDLWNNLELPPGIPANITKVRISISNLTPAGCGNFFALDDINFAFCSDGGPLPVNFLDITASQKSTRVLVEWKTAFEVNNQFFEVERSINGISWSAIGRVNSKGNSQLVQNYSFADDKPAIGTNIYRIRQYDNEMRSSLSKNISIRVNISNTSAHVVANPFVNNITVEFLSKINQQVSARLYDITGKLVVSEKWDISKGNSKKEMIKAASAGKGIYIFVVTDETNEVLYKGKLIKQ